MGATHNFGLHPEGCLSNSVLFYVFLSVLSAPFCYYNYVLFCIKIVYRDSGFTFFLHYLTFLGHSNLVSDNLGSLTGGLWWS